MILCLWIGYQYLENLFHFFVFIDFLLENERPASKIVHWKGGVGHEENEDIRYDLLEPQEWSRHEVSWEKNKKTLKSHDIMTMKLY